MKVMKHGQNNKISKKREKTFIKQNKTKTHNNNTAMSILVQNFLNNYM